MSSFLDEFSSFLPKLGCKVGNLIFFFVNAAKAHSRCKIVIAYFDVDNRSGRGTTKPFLQFL